MNDESNTPLTPVGDDALEARIVAWVLGEASSFEAAELEKLCAEDPALRRFERRIRDLHGLIGEDAKAGPDAEWKLPEAKRSKITDLLGVELAEQAAARKTNRYFTRRILLAAAACFMISVIAYSTFSPAAKKEAVPNGVVASKALPEAGETSTGLAQKGYANEALAWSDSDSPATPAQPLSRPEQELPQVAKAKQLQAGGVGGVGEGGQADAFADGGASESGADRLASNAEFSRRPVPLGANQRSRSERSDTGDMKSDLAALAPDPAVVPESQPAPADVRLNELADLSKKQAPAASAAASAEPGLLAGKDAVRFRNEGKNETALGLDFDSSADPGAAAADFFDLQKMGELADNLEAEPRPALALGGEVRTKVPVPARPAKSTAFKSAGRMDLKELESVPSPAAEGASMSLTPTPTRWFGSSESKPAEKPVGELERDVAQSLERAEEFRKVGKYEEARQVADATLATDPNNADTKRLKEHLADPIQANQALTYESKEQADSTLRTLYAAEGHYNLGKYDEASRAYEDVLRVDPFNKAARRGMERAAIARTDYYRAAYDHTRAGLLAQTDKDWELEMPGQGEASKELAENAPKSGNGDYSGLAHKEMIRRQNAVAQSDTLRDEGRQAYANGDYKLAVEKYKESIRALPDAPMVKDRRAYLGQLLSDGAIALGEQYARAGEKAKARELAVGILVIDPGNAGAKALLLEEKPSKSDETSAASQPFSTFSLHVSDASFKLAKAALERGEQPDPASIRPEEFYNAFDYGDPAPGRGEPVACALEQCANPIIPQRNLVRIGVRAGAAGRGQSTPLNLTLLLDSSGSMEREDRRQGMVMAVQQLAGLLKEGDTVSVIGFSRQPRLLVDRLPGTRARELNTLLAQTPSEGGTNLEEGLKLAEELAKRQFNAAAQNRIVLFTDGAANLGDAQPETLQARIETMRQEGIAFDAAGFGTDGLNDKLLERLTRNGNGRYYIVDRPEDADANFAKQLAGAFRPAAENVKVQVRFNPARVGKYKLIGFEEHRLNKEDFRNDAVDAAEMAAEEAGNALYQIEPLPGGEGEIGEVSVRFRDAASGQMVERTWTIPYEAQAPAFDLAPPSIQLAGLSALAAEKLRQAPMAGAIDLQQLGPILAKVKARYPNSQAVSDLGTMIGKLK